MKLRYRKWLAAIILSATAGSSSWAGDDAAQQDRDTLANLPLSDHQSVWAVTVVPLQYANAEEMAAVIAAILPPGMRVIPYAPTNSLILSGRVHKQ